MTVPDWLNNGPAFIALVGTIGMTIAYGLKLMSDEFERLHVAHRARFASTVQAQDVEIGTP